MAQVFGLYDSGTAFSPGTQVFLGVDGGASGILHVRCSCSSALCRARAMLNVHVIYPSRWVGAKRWCICFSCVTLGCSVCTINATLILCVPSPRCCACLQDMARAEATSIIAAICARFDISLAPGQVMEMRSQRQCHVSCSSACACRVGTLFCTSPCVTRWSNNYAYNAAVFRFVHRM